MRLGRDSNPRLLAWWKCLFMPSVRAAPIRRRSVPAGRQEPRPLTHEHLGHPQTQRIGHAKKSVKDFFECEEKEASDSDLSRKFFSACISDKASFGKRLSLSTLVKRAVHAKFSMNFATKNLTIFSEYAKRIRGILSCAFLVPRSTWNAGIRHSSANEAFNHK